MAATTNASLNPDRKQCERKREGESIKERIIDCFIICIIFCLFIIMFGCFTWNGAKAFVRFSFRFDIMQWHEVYIC